MQAGKLRRRIDIQKNVPTQDAAGQPIASWTSLGRVWASRQPLSARELLQAEQIVGTGAESYRIRYLSTVTTRCRIEDDDVYLDINGILNVDGRNRELILLCKRVA